MATTIGPLIEQLLSGRSFPIHSKALRFQYSIISLVLGGFTVLSSFPIVFSDYIQCLCDPSNIWKDFLETECLTGNITSVVHTTDGPKVVTHVHYQNRPLFFLSLMVMCMIPTLVWKELTGDLYFELVQDMKNYNPEETVGRSIRLQWFLKEEIGYISRKFLFLIMGDLLGAASIAIQIMLCNTFAYSVFFNILSDIATSNNSHSQFFSKSVHCVVEKTAPNGEIDVEEFRCILTMNTCYCSFFEILFVIYGVGAMFQVLSTLSLILAASTTYRRYRTDS